MDGLCCTDHTRGQDILRIFLSKQTVESLLIEAPGQEMLHEQFQFMGKITNVTYFMNIYSSKRLRVASRHSPRLPFEQRGGSMSKKLW